ncbi:MAG: hypothetical protein H5T65_11505 [Chloroflexi bacterium]|nr:hypothetical protein [Chloroflexota bacterium]
MLEDLVARLDELEWEGGPTPAFLEWRDQAEATVRAVFGDRSREAQTFVQVRYTPLTHAACLSDDDRAIAYRRGLAQARFILESLLQQLRREPQ